ncbi:MADS-box domain-containing protein [Favolaschia claudopus]|uniref:MADS-box domain-containing protein n=1 Tax=Favolaschia claudopus TaxID=2862362 RepID=A0AAW0D6N8_9AGAR
MSDPVENGAKSPDASDADPASSLRAAALLTLKSKRRKPTVDISALSGLPQRPQTTDPSVQLDYGQDDIASSPTDVAMTGPTLKNEPNDNQPREEGEISDSEEAASKMASKFSLDPMAIVKVESPMHNLLDRIGDLSHPGPPHEFIIDANHVRPGLSMNQNQYDTAKDILLDLLGWGVPPDYLVDCNLSREIVYYVFSELNLRLPHNLDITGLIPYTPSHVALYSRSLSATPPSPRSEAPFPSRPLHGHPSLPPKPGSTAFSGPSPVQPRSTARRSSSSPTSSPHHLPSSNYSESANGSLHDMERQRRQELLARKAVQASRKIKPPSEASSIASSSHTAPDPAEQLGVQDVQDQDVEMTPAVATEAVDDFLKSIGEKSVTPERPIQPEPESTDSMEVDEIPGLRSYRDVNPFSGTDSQTTAYIDQVVISPAESSFSTAPPPLSASTISEPPPSSSDSRSTTFALDTNGYDTEQLSHHHQAFQRRGSKRPTAADFVDFDAGSRNGYYNTSIPHPLKRKTASFASLSGHRKLVIDLSDSEGEGQEYAMHDGADWESSGYNSPAPGLLSATPGGRATPPVGTTPAALMEKEQEIRKMRELIARAEMTRKQRAMSRPATLPQQEEDGMVAEASTSQNGVQSNESSIAEHTLIEAAIAADSSNTQPAVLYEHIDIETVGDQNGLNTSTNDAQGTSQSPILYLACRTCSAY